MYTVILWVYVNCLHLLVRVIKKLSMTNNGPMEEGSRDGDLWRDLILGERKPLINGQILVRMEWIYMRTYVFVFMEYFRRVTTVEFHLSGRWLSVSPIIRNDFALRVYLSRILQN